MATFLASLMSARAQSEPRYDVAMANVMVPMRDGVKLSTDIYRPARNGAAVEGRFPAVLERTPYDKGGGSAAADIAPYFVSADTSSSCRTCAAATNPKDTGVRSRRPERWLRHRQMDRRAALVGRRHRHHGHFLRRRDAARPRHRAMRPHVKAMIPRNAMSDFGRYGVRHNGAFELRFFNWVLTSAIPRPERRMHSRRPQRAAADPAAAAALRRYGHPRPRLRAQPASAPRHHAAQIRSGLRSLADRGHEPRRLRRFLEEPRLERGRSP